MMSVSTEVGHHSILHTPRSPVSICIDSSRRASLKHVLSEKQFEPPVPRSPLPRLTRKRAASLNTDVANESRLLSLASNDPRAIDGPTSEPAKEQVCLCQPDPKIPRPRNAFILYRQHYQAQVVAQHPGLANPEISKIIGEQWRGQAPDIKNDWKRLAEEEKQRHSRQYPGYRYQPRRAGKTNSLRPATSSTDDTTRCPNCGGQYISTPGTPLTPFTPSYPTPRSDRSVSSYSSTQSEQFERPRTTVPMQQTPRMETPRHGVPFQQQMHRRPFAPHPHPIHTSRDMDEDMELSPGQKRRRFDEGSNQRGYVPNSPIYAGAPKYPRHGAAPMSAGGYRQQLPGPGMLVKTGSMGPPPNPGYASSPITPHPRQQYPQRQSIVNESLRLPPIQTQMNNGNPNAAQRHPSDARAEARESHAKSVEAMVMTIPYLNKIKVLTKISPPLATPSPTSPAQEIRGALITVEGPDTALVSDIGAFINDYLSKEGNLAVKTWGTTPSPSSSPPPVAPPAPIVKKASIPSTIDTEMKDDSPTADDATSPKTAIVIPDKKPSVAERKEEDHDHFIDYLSIISQWHTKSSEIQKFITTTSAPPSSSTPQKILPVALVPSGFSLTISDTFALKIPINDSYAPVDHWQWMATLWRGIAGPDITIYVSRVGADELAKGGVEIRGECGAIVVKVAEGGRMDEKTARRLGFEVVEMVRGIEGGVGFPRG